MAALECVATGCAIQELAAQVREDLDRMFEEILRKQEQIRIHSYYNAITPDYAKETVEYTDFLHAMEHRCQNNAVVVWNPDLRQPMDPIKAKLDTMADFNFISWEQLCRIGMHHKLNQDRAIFVRNYNNERERALGHVMLLHGEDGQYKESEFVVLYQLKYPMILGRREAVTRLTLELFQQMPVPPIFQKEIKEEVAADIPRVYDDGDLLILTDGKKKTSDNERAQRMKEEQEAEREQQRQDRERLRKEKWELEQLRKEKAACRKKQDSDDLKALSRSRTWAASSSSGWR